MSPLLRRGADGNEGIAPRRPHAGLLRRERRALVKAREDELRELGGLLVEMYRRGGFREDLLAERSATVVGIDARLAEIEELLTNRSHVIRCECGAPILRGSHFCPELRPVAARRRAAGGRVGGDRDRAGAERLMTSEAAERRTAIAAADTTCPRCGAARKPTDGYCLDCGLRLPVVAGAVPSLRRGWLRRLGWYPGDWVWLSLLTLLVAAGGAAAAIVITDRHRSHPPVVLTAVAGVAVGEPATPASSTTTATADTANTATLPSAPEPGAPTRANGRLLWPAGVNGWTIVLVSYPKASGRATALSTATQSGEGEPPPGRNHRLGRLREPAARLFRRLQRRLRLESRRGCKRRHGAPGRVRRRVLPPNLPLSGDV